jgi:alpha-glucuronidase
MKSLLILTLSFFLTFSASAKDGYELWLDYRPVENTTLKTEVDRLFSGIYFFGQSPTYDIIQKELELSGQKMLGKAPVFSVERLAQTQVWMGTREELSQV